MEFMPRGSLSDYIKKSGVLWEKEASWFTKQMLEGVTFLHFRNIIHGDIKGSNVLLDGKGNVKLADFGLSETIQVKIVSCMQQ
ncbi:mitogen-activated protein kinase kinase kinase 2-like [Orbicella faveolata]|uniref:mitogen-activated protein kinase kinase kinase 2-like n=1 Tax=Orbicella faveolata TaxID=48498 RepID=UPI0009E64A9E|nr:mitogen-activated protein kinase kinase kinase 2-like [Orbicella faveolata]